MQKYPVTLEEIAVIGGTRAALGAGIGLLLAGKIDQRHRRAVGWTLVAVGALSTLPLILRVLRSRVKVEDEPEPEPAARFTPREYVS
jgi:hypothetical protein